MSLNGCLGPTERGAWRGVSRKGCQRVGGKVGEGLAKGWHRVGEGLAKGWRRVSGFPCTLQFRNSRGARLETQVCDSMGDSKMTDFLREIAPRASTRGQVSLHILDFLCDNSIWSFPSVSSLSDYSIWRVNHRTSSISVHCLQILLSLRKHGI